MSDDELKLTRRAFLEQSAMASAMTAATCSIALKTDALAHAQEHGEFEPRSFGPGPNPYTYADDPA